MTLLRRPRGLAKIGNLRAVPADHLDEDVEDAQFAAFPASGSVASCWGYHIRDRMQRK